MEKKKEWIDIETNAGFYPQECTPSKVPWDVKEATKSMKYIHMDDQVAQRMRNTFNRGVMMSPINRYILNFIVPSSSLKTICFSH